VEVAVVIAARQTPPRVGGNYNPLLVFIPDKLATDEILKQTKNMSGYFSVDLQ